MNIKSCVITICQSQQSIKWKKVTENVIAKGQTNKTLPSYIQIGDTICLNCYNGIVVNCSYALQQYALKSSPLSSVPISTPTPPPPPVSSSLSPLLLLQSPPPPPSTLFFFKATEIITNILYYNKKEKKPTIYLFYEFHMVMEGEDERLKSLFNELYLSSNPFSKNGDSQAQAKKQLLYVCYFFY